MTDSEKDEVKTLLNRLRVEFEAIAVQARDEHANNLAGARREFQEILERYSAEWSRDCMWMRIICFAFGAIATIAVGFSINGG